MQGHISFNVFRRVELLDRLGPWERCASFVSRGRAETFILREMAPFAEQGSDAGRWWCRQNDNLFIEYRIMEGEDTLGAPRQAATPGTEIVGDPD